MPNFKRIFLILSFVTITVILGYLLYFFFFRPLTPEKPPTNLNLPLVGELPPTGVNVNIPIMENINAVLPGQVVNINGQLVIVPPPSPEPISPIAKGGLTQTLPVADVATAGITMAANGADLFYYDKSKEKFFKVTPAGTITPLTDEVFYQAQKVTWASNKEKAILEYPDGANILYNFSDSKQITLPKHWEDFNFSPNGDQLVFKSLGLGEENRWLAIANADGSQAKKIEHLGNKDASVYPLWSPNNQIIAVFRENVGADKQNLYFIGQHGENFKLMVLEGKGFSGQWSPDGNNLLYSVYSETSDFKPTLWIASAAGENIGENRRDLGLQTWADKCSFASLDILYCAVPQKLETGAGMFREEMDNFPTDIYKIDLQTGFKSKVAQPDGDYNISKIMVSSDNQLLYFADKDSGKIYRINLK